MRSVGEAIKRETNIRNSETVRMCALLRARLGGFIFGVIVSKQIPLTKGKFCIVDDEDYEELSKYKWNIRNGYASREKYLGGGYRNEIRETYYMHRVIMNAPKGMDVDHINKNTLDNRKSNLRVCSHSQNMKNQKRRSNNKSGYTGVFKAKENRFFAYIKINYKRIHIGTFRTAEDAAHAYNEKARELFGEYASLNKIE